MYDICTYIYLLAMHCEFFNLEWPNKKKQEETESPPKTLIHLNNHREKRK